MGAECFCAAEGLSDEDHTELNIKCITLSIYRGSCQVWSAGVVKKKTQQKKNRPYGKQIQSRQIVSGGCARADEFRSSHHALSCMWVMESPSDVHNPSDPAGLSSCLQLCLWLCSNTNWSVCVCVTLSRCFHDFTSYHI